jgi:SAM-dependent methyltransferase
VEPCDSWREVSERRANELGLAVEHCSADGAALPFADQSFDAVVSLQVLEHVKHPRRVVEEIARVLKPGGKFFIACENYLSFREQHYGVLWLPLLPRRFAALYLRARGRNPDFLQNHVTYTTWPQLLRDFVDSGLVDNDWMNVLQSNPSQWKLRSKCLYYSLSWLIGDRTTRRLIILLHNRSKVFRIGFRACGARL